MDAVNIQTKFGLGEIVTTHQRRKGNQIIHDQKLLKRKGGPSRRGPKRADTRAQTTGSASGFRLTASDPNWRRKCR